jgi:monoamine oxidase
MPNLYTSLLARRLGTTTLAPTEEPPSVPEAISTQPNPEWKRNIFESALSEIVSAGPKPPLHAAAHSVGIVGASLAGLSAAYEPTAGMVAFAGAKHAAELSKLSDEKAEAQVIACLEDVYKGVSSKVSNPQFVNWPKRKWSKASYSFPKCGETLRWGPKFETGFGGKLQFAGEHTCYAFTGYMEGALQSGFRLARKIVSRDGGQW